MCLYAFVQFFMIIDATATFVKEISDVAEIENDRVLVYVSLLHAFLVIIFVSCPNIPKLQITLASPPAYIASKDSACIILWKLVGVSLSIISPKPNTLLPLLTSNFCNFVFKFLC